MNVKWWNGYNLLHLCYREYWTDHHAKELGLWDTSHDSVAGEQAKVDKQKNAENNVQPACEPR